MESSLEELRQLAATAGAEVVGQIVQRLESPSASHYIGKGKVEELKAQKGITNYDLIVFDNELSPVQQANLEDALGVKVIDRTALILDIFAKRAQTREGRLQVELAQHQYLLPRLAGQWSHLERLGGGIGTRGPGESQLETDRRLIRRHIQRLEERIEEVRKHRSLYRASRKRTGIKVVSLVGYTNAGKSTLFNNLSKAQVLAEDKLFSTLDPTTRRVRLSNDVEILMTDTVGFIQKLPPAIVAAFRATLEELDEADLLLHVVDITHKSAAEQSYAVESILKELHLATKSIIVVLNKIDLLVKDEAELSALKERTLQQQALGSANDTVLVSAARKWGFDSLMKKIAEKLALGS